MKTNRKNRPKNHFFIATGLGVLFSVLWLPCLLLAQGSLTPPGAPAPTMKTLDQLDAKLDQLDSKAEKRTPISSLPFTISASGSYYLTQNLTGVAGQDGITIDADGVTINLNGFALTGVANSGRGIRVSSNLLKNIIIHNGHVKGWGGSGIDAIFARNTLFDRLVLSDNGTGTNLTNVGHGLWAGSGSVVSNCTAMNNGLGLGNGSSGFALSDSCVIVNCSALGHTGSGAWGISVGGSSVVKNCSAVGNNAGGISTILGCSVIDCSAGSNNGASGVGIQLGNFSAAIHCTASFNLGSVSIGISAGDFCKISGCTTVSNTSDGIKAATGGEISSNLSSSNTGAGVHVTGNRETIDGNNVISNTGSGIKVDAASNFVIRNRASGNGINYEIVAGNRMGQILMPNTNSGAIAGNFSGVTNSGTTDPFANISY